MVLQQLLDLLVNGHAFQIRIVLLELQTLGGVLAVLGRDVTADAGNASTLLLGALACTRSPFAFFAIIQLLLSYLLITMISVRCPSAAAFFRAASRPILLMLRNPAADTVRRTH